MFPSGAQNKRKIGKKNQEKEWGNGSKIFFNRGGKERKGSTKKGGERVTKDLKTKKEGGKARKGVFSCQRVTSNRH